MALKLLGFPDINPADNYQCGIVAAAFPGCDDDCTRCDQPIATMISFVGVFNRYRELAVSGSADPVPQFDPTYVAYPVFEQVKRSIDLSRPVIAGISPDGPPDRPEDSEHAVVITGYDAAYRGSGEPWVIVRDPYPYGAGQSPWTKAGYPYAARTGRALVPWSILRDQMNLTSAVFFERPDA